MPRKQPPADGRHEVKQGEWVGSIAQQYGFTDWQAKIWERPENSELRERREDPHLLAPGDILFVPPLEEKTVSGETGRRHRFKVKARTDLLRLRVFDTDGELVKSAPYELEVELPVGSRPFRQQNRTTDAEGMLEEEIPFGARKGKLKLPEQDLEFELQLSHLEPLAEDDEELLVRALQQRLSSLGFNPGPVDGVGGPLTEDAIREFQRFCKENAGGNDPTIIDAGEPDGKVTKTVLDALKSYYGS